jgi:amino acid adenylation domain-containing protein
MIHGELRQMLLEVLGVEVDQEKLLLESGVDSLEIIQLRNNIEYKYKVDLQLQQFMKMSFSEIEDYIENAVMQGHTKKESNSLSYHTEKYFPLNELQQAYWIGRTNQYELGNVSTYAYMEFEQENLDVDKLRLALDKVIERQQMLRTVIHEDGMQEVLSIQEAKYTLDYIDITNKEKDEKKAILENERSRMSHQIFKLGNWPFFEIRVYKIDEKRTRVNFGIDMLIADAFSIQIFLNNLKEFYHNQNAVLNKINFNFRDYVMKEVDKENEPSYQAADQYWNERCRDIPLAPKIPLKKNPEAVKKPIFKHIGRRISPEDYKKLKLIAYEKKVTVSVVLLSIYAKVLAKWSQEDSLSINVTYLDRKMYDEHINEIMGQFASFTILPLKDINSFNFHEFTKKLQNDLWTDLDNRAVSGGKILQKIRKYNNDVSTFMPIVFTCALEDIAQTDWLGDIVYSISQTSQIWLDNQTFEDNGALMLFWDYIEELFPDGMILEMMDAYENAIIRYANDSKIWDEYNFSFMSKHYCNIENNNSEIVPKMPLVCIQEAIAKYPENIAIRSGDMTISYSELDEMTNKVANWISKKVEHKNIIGISMEKGWQQVVAVIGIVKAGCAYLPIDSNLPKERIEYILKESNAKYILTQEWLIHKYQDINKVYNFSVLDNILQEENDVDRIKVNIQEHDLIYTIYTSGSTGNPSGVMIEHIGLGNAIMSTNNTYHMGENDSIIAMTPLHHDMSVYDIFGMLSAGGKIVIPDEKVRKEPALLADLLLKERVSIWNSVPSLIDVFVDYISEKPDKIPSFLRYVFLGGDWISIETCKKLFKLINNLTIISVGGPTETTMWNIWFPFKKVDNSWNKIPYGVPIHNTKYYIFNNIMEDCPIWVPGRIYSSGIGVARGYQNDENKTKNRFVYHPKTKERLFDSGDLGYYLPDGNIAILGRADNQVKINGIRIEIEEIEIVLKKCPGVDNSAVVLDDSMGMNRIIAFVVGEVLIVESIIEYLRKKLPEYMLPKDIIIVPEILLSANHKVDRKRMIKEYITYGKEDVQQEVASTLDYNLEEEITNLIKEVLKVDSIGLDINITDVGATSIELIKIINQLERNYHKRMELAELFENLTIRKLVAYFGKKNNKKVEHMNEHSSQKFLSKYEIITNRMEREKFKLSNQGLRRDLEDKEVISLDLPPIDDEIIKRFDMRRSFRHYEMKQIKFKDFSNFLFLLSNFDEEKYPNFLYASGGGLYSIQIYIHVNNDGIEDLSNGLYYYDRNKHDLKKLAENVQIGSNIHWSSNQAIYEEAAFSIYLVADYDAVGPMYGERGIHFVTIEAGLISQLLEEHAKEFNIGICQIGNIDFSSIEPYLNLKESHVHIHTMLGGYIDYSHDYLALQNNNDYLQYEYEFTVEDKEKHVKTAKVSELEQHVQFDETLIQQIDSLVRGME